MAKRQRKTFDVAELKETINTKLADPNTSTEAKKALCSTIEHILMKTGNYKGFNSVHWIKEGGCQRWQDAGKPENREPFLGNEWRRFYY